MSNSWLIICCIRATLSESIEIVDTAAAAGGCRSTCTLVGAAGDGVPLVDTLVIGGAGDSAGVL